jgi:hypothetical protein
MEFTKYYKGRGITLGVSMFSMGSPLAIFPVVLTYLFGMRRRDKLVVFLSFLFFNIAVGNFDYISFILVFLSAILIVNRLTEILLISGSALSLLLPFSFSFQSMLFAVGAVAILIFILPSMIETIHPHKVDKEKARKELYKKLARIK